MHCAQLRAHADVAGWLKKPIILSAFSKQRRTGKSDMATRNAFFEMVYQEAERSDAIAGALPEALSRGTRCTQHSRPHACARKSHPAEISSAQWPVSLTIVSSSQCAWTPVSGAGTLFWLLASNSYPDYDGYTVYTSKVAVQQPAPAWPQLSPELVDAVGPVRQQSMMN